MPTFNDCRDIMFDNYTNPKTAQKAVILSGQPGCAKTAMGPALAKLRGIPLDRVRTISPARINPVNTMGIPRNTEDNLMVWSEPEEMRQLSEGPWILCIDELGHCGATMQSTMGGLMLDRCTNKIKLSPDVWVFGTTNRVQDKAGSKPIMTHTANRANIQEMSYDHTDFIPWGIDEELDPIGLAYIQLAPGQLFDFEPDRLINATARSWEYALNVNTNLRPDLYLQSLSGIIPPGIAASYQGFRETVARMPDPVEVHRNPSTAPIPRDVDAVYAIIANLMLNTTEVAQFNSLMQYVARLPPEYQTLYVHTTIKKVPACTSSSAYVTWIHNNHQTLGGGKA